MNSVYRRNILIFSLIVILGACLDIVTKICFDGVEIKLIGNFLWICSVHNEGAAFSLLQGARWWFVAISFVALFFIFFIIFFNKISSKLLFIISLSFISAGIIGNLVDRIAYGYVRDFIDFRFSGFPIFNFADSLLCIGCALLILFIILDFVKDIKRKKSIKHDDKFEGPSDDK